MANKEGLMKRLSFFWAKKYKLIVLIGLIVVLGLVLIIALKFRIFASITGGGNCKYLISYGVNHNGAYPEYIGWYNGKSNLSTIESLPEFPYNGVGIETWQYSPTNVMHLIMEPTKLGYQTIHDEYKPFIDLAANGLKPTKLKHNFIMVHLEQAGGFYDPNNATDKANSDAKWANVADNFANLSRVAKEINDSGFPIDGIFLDNEGPYGGSDGFWHCGGTYAPACSAGNLTSFQEQSRQRGKQVMDAIKPYSYPGFHFMFMHSTDVSCTLDPNDRNNPPGLGPNWVEYANQLLGSFTIGLAESARGTNVRVIDGGEESYGYLTQDYFTVSKDYRNSGMATQMDGAKLACNFIPAEDRLNIQTWSDLFDTAFAMYNQDPASTPGQTVSTIQQSMKLALQNTDNYVWFYLEGGTTTIGSPYGTQIGQDWTHNIKLARDAVTNDPSCEGMTTSPSPSQSPIPITPSLPVSPSPSGLCEPSPKPTLTASAASSNQVNLSWTDTLNENGYSVKRSTTSSSGPFSEVFNTGPTANPHALSWQDTTVSANTNYWYRVDAYNGCGTGITSSNVAQVTTPGAGTLPSVPKSLTAVGVSPSQINLNWIDASSNESNFSIERSGNNSGWYKIALAGPNVTSYSDTGLQPNTTYYYRVQASNAYGSSAYSNTASAKTKKKRWFLF